MCVILQRDIAQCMADQKESSLLTESNTENNRNYESHSTTATGNPVLFFFPHHWTTCSKIDLIMFDNISEHIHSCSLRNSRNENMGILIFNKKKKKISGVTLSH